MKVLQRDLDYVANWCKDNKLDLNISKCKVMSYTRRTETYIYDYSLSGITLERCNNIRDLGVIFDRTLSFIKHIEHNVNRAYRMYGFIYRNCRDFDSVECLILLFNSFIRSILEYASLVWCPIYSVHINNIEIVQRRFLKFLIYTVDRIYPERGYDYQLMLNRFDFISLQRRRFVIGIKFLHKLLNNAVDCPWLLARINFNVPRPISRYHCSFYCSRSKTNLMIKSPINMLCSNFNSIDSNLLDIHFNSIHEIIITL